MSIFAPVREMRRFAAAVSGVLALSAVLLPIGFGEAEAGSNGWRGSSKYSRQPSMPQVTAPRVPSQSKIVSKPSKSDDDDDRDSSRNESNFADKFKRGDDDEDRQGRDEDRQSRDERGSSDRGGAKSGNEGADGVPNTVADLVKRLFNPQPPAVNPGLRDQPREADLKGGPLPHADVKHSRAKPLQKGVRPLADLRMRVPMPPQTDILVRNLGPSTLSRALASGMQVESRRDLGVLGSTLTRLIVPPSMDAAKAKALLQEMSPSTAVNLNQRYRLYPSARDGDGAKPQVAGEPARTTGGCTSDRCYGASTIGWQDRLSHCAKGLSIGVIDTGIDSTHPALAHNPERFKFGQFGPGYRGTGSDLHGTGVLALLAGNAKSSTPGLIPNAKFYVADIFFADENGMPVSTTLHLLEALEWMDRLKVQIINLSLSGPRDDLVQAAISRMSKPRVVDGVSKPAVIFVAAAGNGGPGAPPSYPAAYPEALAVTAVTRELRSYRRANQGDYIDVAAPGVDIWTALPDGRQGYQTGTSFATPFMTAVVASLYRGLPARKTKEAVLERISVQDLGAPGRDRIYGRGLVQAPTGCGPSSPWSPAVVAARSRLLTAAGASQRTASR